MSLSVALPAELKETEDSILTFVVPSTDGCNLKCAFCYIQQRKEEADRAVLSPNDYVKFISDIYMCTNIAAICIQGYEPLLPDSFDYTQTILAKAKEIDVASSLITNGTYLADRAYDLEDAKPYRVFVSLDSASADLHDRQRGVEGAFNAALKGLRKARELPHLSDALAVTSVLMPRRAERLMGMPKLLEELGIRRWIVNPLMKVGKAEIGGPKASRSDIFRDALVLKRLAEKHGVELVVDDEFARLSSEVGEDDDRVVDINEMRFLKIQRLRSPGGVFRLLPTGQCSVGYELLQEVNSQTPIWEPKSTNAFEFIEMLQSH